MAITARRRAAAARREASEQQVALPVRESTTEPRRQRKEPKLQAIHLPFASIAAANTHPSLPQATAQAAPRPNAVIQLAADDSKKSAKRGKGVAASPVEAAPPAAPKWRVFAGNLAAGAIAGCVVEAVLYPLDTIKTRLQMMRSGGGMRALIRGGGGKALYAGIWGNLAGVAPASAIFMACYEPAKAAIAEHHSAQASFIGAGAIAGLAASLVRVPTEVVKQRMQSGEFKAPTVAVRKILGRQGPRGMFVGYWAFLLRDLPFDAIEFWAYDSLKLNGQKTLKRELNAAEVGVCGAFSGAVAGFTTTPLDVLKTRLMTQGTGTDSYKSVFDCAVRIYREEGAKAFLRGWEPRVIWIGIGGCIFFGALEQAKRLLVPRSEYNEKPAH